jgi:hypothetical protein
VCECRVVSSHRGGWGCHAWDPQCMFRGKAIHKIFSQVCGVCDSILGYTVIRVDTGKLNRALVLTMFSQIPKCQENRNRQRYQSSPHFSTISKTTKLVGPGGSGHAHWPNKCQHKNNA